MRRTYYIFCHGRRGGGTISLGGGKGGERGEGGREREEVRHINRNDKFCHGRRRCGGTCCFEGGWVGGWKEGRERGGSVKRIVKKKNDKICQGHRGGGTRPAWPPRGEGWSKGRRGQGRGEGG